MTDKQPEALRLAEHLEQFWADYDQEYKAAKELRRLHEVNAELLEALKLAQAIIGHPDDYVSKFIAAAIAKAEEQA